MSDCDLRINGVKSIVIIMKTVKKVITQVIEHSDNTKNKKQIKQK